MRAGQAPAGATSPARLRCPVMRGLQPRRRCIAVLAAVVVASLPVAPAVHAQDSAAPKGAEPHWLPNEEWVNNLWLPYDEQRLYAALYMSRGEIFRFVAGLMRRTRSLRSRAANASRSTASPTRLVANHRGRVSAVQYRVLVAMPSARSRRGTSRSTCSSMRCTRPPSPSARDADLRRALPARSSSSCAAPSSARCRSASSTGARASSMQRGVERRCATPPRAGVRRGFLHASARRALYALPSAAPGCALALPEPLQRPDGRAQPTRTYRTATCARGRDRRRQVARYRGTHTAMTSPQAERFGEIHLRVALRSFASPRACAVSAPGHPRSRLPPSSYNAVLSGDGSAVAFETAESTFPLAKRVGQMSALRARLAKRLRSRRRATRAVNAWLADATAFNPSLSTDGRLVAYEATDSGDGDEPSHSGAVRSMTACSRHRDAA